MGKPCSFAPTFSVKQLNNSFLISAAALIRKKPFNCFRLALLNLSKRRKVDDGKVENQAYSLLPLPVAIAALSILGCSISDICSSPELSQASERELSQGSKAAAFNGGSHLLSGGWVSAPAFGAPVMRRD